MSLKFLSKKSWHTTNLNNVEKVWMQEQKAAEEDKKLLDLQKQILEERQIQELRQLQVASGQQVKVVDSTLDWMYEGPSAHQDQSTEEYLLGKMYKPQEGAPSEVKQLVKEVGSVWMNKLSTKNDMFTRTHEDPLLVMKKNEKLSREGILNNPVKMARIRHKITQELEEKEEERRKRKDAKKQKKERKHKDRSRSRSKDRDRPRRSRSPDRFARHADRGERSERGDRIERGEDRRGRASSRSRSRDREQNQPRERLLAPRAAKDDQAISAVRGAVPGYGLLRRGEEECSGRDYLGPRPELVAQRRERDAQEATARRPKEKAAPLTAEEKARRLAEMQRDAEVNDAMRLSRLVRPSEGAKEGRGKADPSFLQSMRSQVYTANDGATMEERLQQNRHYVQRASEMDSHGFMKR